MKYLKLFEQVDEWDDPFGEDAEINVNVDDVCREIKEMIINNPRFNSSIDKNVLEKYYSSHDKRYDIVTDRFNELGEWSKIYDHINYEDIKVGSVIMCNILNITKDISKYTIIEKQIFSNNILRFGVQYGDNRRWVPVWGIKGVIKY